MANERSDKRGGGSNRSSRTRSTGGFVEIDLEMILHWLCYIGGFARWIDGWIEDEKRDWDRRRRIRRGKVLKIRNYFVLRSEGRIVNFCAIFLFETVFYHLRIEINLTLK